MDPVPTEVKTRSSDLFTPTLQEFANPARRPVECWTDWAQYVVAFFGGVTALVIFAFRNALRLKVSRRRLYVMAACSMMAWLAYWACTLYLPTLRLEGLFGNLVVGPSEVVRVAGRAMALLLCVILLRIEEPASRTYLSLWNGRFASPWLPGLGALALGFFVDWLVAALLHARFR